MLSDAPPSREDLTTSRTCLLLVDVNTLTSSGMIAPARVPQEMMIANFHHTPAASPDRLPRTYQVVTKVRTMDTALVSHTSWVSGASKFIRVALA